MRLRWLLRRSLHLLCLMLLNLMDISSTRCLHLWRRRRWWQLVVRWQLSLWCFPGCHWTNWTKFLCKFITVFDRSNQRCWRTCFLQSLTRVLQTRYVRGSRVSLLELVWTHADTRASSNLARLVQHVAWRTSFQQSFWQILCWWVVLCKMWIWTCPSWCSYRTRHWWFSIKIIHLST